MENEQAEFKLALFVGGIADGWTKEIVEVPDRRNYHDTFYIFTGLLETKTISIVQLHVLKSISNEERQKRIQIIKKSV